MKRLILNHPYWLAVSNMGFEVFEVPRDKKGEMTKVASDDLIGRQSITTRDAKSLGIEGDCYFLLIEGSDESLEKARAMLGDSGVKPSVSRDEIHKKIKDEEDDAADGMGMLFG